jgi:hemerythrin superfamily protein
MGTTHDGDAVDMLLEQHQEIRRLFTEVENAAPDRRQQVFDQLRRLLAVHETAEEQVVHPAARRAVPDGDHVVDERLQEENAAKQVLAELEGMDASSPQFMSRFVQLRDAVLAHAEHEEREEFPQLRAHVNDRQRSMMATGLKTAEKLAPTHPHPGTESATKNTLMGPVASIVDRTRDALRGRSRRGE